MDELALRGEDDLNKDELDYLDVPMDLVETYDERKWQATIDQTPRERHKALLDEASMSTADLGRLLGNSGLVSQILLGRRELSKAHICVLSEHFKLNAEYFL